ncbi:MAG: hypothetical protein KF883_12150 [Thermomicrobiales bacterium]|nr:hypothetical protein [Thermomicrobiales bacterium]
MAAQREFEKTDAERESRHHSSVPSHRVETTAGKREVDLYVRTYTTLLQSSGAVGISSLEPAHLTAAPSLHAGAMEPEPDMNAMIYSIQRLPDCIMEARDIVLGQTIEAFQHDGFSNIAEWTVVGSPGRRRKWFWDGESILAAQISSTSDLDDLIPSIVALQIELTKIHRLLRGNRPLIKRIRQIHEELNAGGIPGPEAVASIGDELLIGPTDWLRLQAIWGARLWPRLLALAPERKRFWLRMLSGSFVGYTRSTRHWWRPVQDLLREADLDERPVYFVSSNTHSLVNILAGTAMRRKEALTQYIRETAHAELLSELDALDRGESRSSWENLLYFAARTYFNEPGNERDRDRRNAEEIERGIAHISALGAMDVGVQVIDLARLDPESLDPRLLNPGERLNPGATDAIIININYPLGMAAYHIMNQVAMSTDLLRGIYVLGKAATLNGRIGDVMIANVVYDEHSGNTYWLDNCFSYGDLAPYLVYGAALDNQKAVTVKGTYLQNQGYLDFYYRENYTVVEMEAGPYLNAIYEDLFLDRYPVDEAINLVQHSSHHLDLGIIHYASDTPYTRSHTLGARGMSYYGMDSTYASTLAILRRIFHQSGLIATT